MRFYSDKVVARMRSGWAILGDNPVLTLSLRRAMRRGTTFALQFCYVAALLALTTIVYLVVYSGPSVTANAGERMGRGLFLSIALLQTTALSLTGSVLGAGSVALEREHRTFEALRLTLLSPVELLSGKYLSLLLLHALLIATSIPIACLGFLFGGVSPGEVVRATLLTSLSTAAALAVGLACSVHCSRSALAISLAAGLAIGGLVGVPALFMAYSAYTGTSGSQGNGLFFALITLNPLFAECHLFLKAPQVPPEAADFDALVLLGIVAAAWVIGLGGLRGEMGRAGGRGPRE